MKQINLKISEDSHALLRKLADDSGVTSAKVIELALAALASTPRIDDAPKPIELPPAPPPLEYGEDDGDDLSDVLGAAYNPQPVAAPTEPAPPPAPEDPNAETDPDEDDLLAMLEAF